MTELDASAPSPPSRRRLSATLLGLAVIGIALPAVAISIAYRACTGTTSAGSISVRGDGVDWRSTLGACTADPTALAVDLGADGPPVVRAIVDPIDGPRLEVRAAWAAAPIVLTAASCPGLKVDVRRTGQRPDGAHLLGGAASASCRVTTRTGTAQLDLDTWWRACHQADE